MVKIFTTGNPFGAGFPNLAGLQQQTADWEASQAIDEVLVGYSAIWPQNIVTASIMSSMTKRLGLIVAHRPGVMHPTIAASAFGSMDFLSGGGRIALNIVSGSSPKDLYREGDFLPKEERYERAVDYVELMKQCWQSIKSFDYESKYVKAEGVRQLMRPPAGHIPIYMGGESDEAVDFGAKHADVYMLWGEPLAGTKERVDRVKAAAVKYGRTPEFSLSLRLFLADTDEEAWTKARAVEQVILDAEGTNRFFRSASTDTSVGKTRQLATIGQDIHDDCFWTGLVKLLGGFANTAALVGTPDRVMAALKKYRDAGINAFLLTTGQDGFWEPSLEEFALRVKQELA